MKNIINFINERHIDIPYYEFTRVDFDECVHNLKQMFTNIFSYAIIPFGGNGFEPLDHIKEVSAMDIDTLIAYLQLAVAILALLYEITHRD